MIVLKIQRVRYGNQERESKKESKCSRSSRDDSNAALKAIVWQLHAPSHAARKAQVCLTCRLICFLNNIYTYLITRLPSCQLDYNQKNKYENTEKALVCRLKKLLLIVIESFYYALESKNIKKLLNVNLVFLLFSKLI